MNLIKQQINNRDRLRAETVKYKTLNKESFRELEQTREELQRDQDETKNDAQDETYEQYQFSSSGPSKVNRAAEIKMQKRSGTVVVKKHKKNIL